MFRVLGNFVALAVGTGEALCRVPGFPHCADLKLIRGAGNVHASLPESVPFLAEVLESGNLRFIPYAERALRNIKASCKLIGRWSDKSAFAFSAALNRKHLKPHLDSQYVSGSESRE